VETPDAATPDIAPIRSRLREKTPEILIEAGSVVLALLLAFGANAWHQHREETALAARAHQGIFTELKSNREQLDATRESVDKAIARLRAAITRVDAGNELDQSPIAIISPLSPLLPSSAAWGTAQATGTVGDFDYAWTLQVAKTYELQALFLSAQQRVIYPPTPVAVPGMEKAGSPARRMYYALQLQQELLNLQVLSNFGGVLAHSYGELLDAPAANASAGKP
jgi:hypothetical protein